jgi:chloride channel protein, CIC family
MKLSVSSVAAWLRLSEDRIFLVLTIVVGVLAALCAVLFTLAIKATTVLLFGVSPSALRFLLVPTLISLATGFLLARFFPEAAGSGVPQTEAAFHLQQGQIPGRVAFGKFLTGVLCIGSGHSMGREGPSVQIGAGLASSLGRLFRLSPTQAQSLVPVAAAAALSAAFNTPIAAVLFALEEIIGDMNAKLIGSTVAASVTAVIVERSILGSSPIFHVPQYRFVHPAELIAYAGLGVIGGIVSLAFSKSLLKLRAMFLRLPARTKMFQPAIGGVIIGVLLIFFPQVLGVGYEYVDQALNGGLLLHTMFALCVAKLAATVISYSSGNAGGIFAPSLYLGAMAGGVTGVLVHRFAPFPTGNPGAYAMVGMGTLFAGIIRAPMTSVLMIFELTDNYQVLVPLMVANMTSFWISKQYQPKPLYHALLEQDRIYLPEVGARMATSAWRARDIMSRNYISIPPESTFKRASEIVSQHPEKCFLVGHDGSFSGVITRDAIDQATRSGLTEAPITDSIIRNPAYVYPDQVIGIALERLGKNPGLLPVLARGEPRTIEGVITSRTVIQFMENNQQGQVVDSRNIGTTTTENH